MRAWAILSVGFPWLAAAALADALPVYSGPVSVEIGASEVVLTLEMTAEAAEEAGLRIRAAADPAPALPAAEAALRAEIDAIPQSCTDRLDLGDVAIDIADGRIVAHVGFRYARWLCERKFGVDVRAQLFTETATIAAGFEPFARDGRLQLRLADFEVSELGELARALDAENWMRGELERAVAVLNADPEFAQPPVPVRDEGYRYESVEIDAAGLLRLAIAGPDSALALLRIRAALDGDG